MPACATTIDAGDDPNLKELLIAIVSSLTTPTCGRRTAPHARSEEHVGGTLITLGAITATNRAARTTSLIFRTATTTNFEDDDCGIPAKAVIRMRGGRFARSRSQLDYRRAGRKRKRRSVPLPFHSRAKRKLMRRPRTSRADGAPQVPNRGESQAKHQPGLASTRKSTAPCSAKRVKPEQGKDVEDAAQNPSSKLRSLSCH